MKPATIEDALIYAIKAHKGQVDKSGFPVILHPIIVMLQMHTNEERILALCHDIPEDTGKSPHLIALDLGMGYEWETWLDVLTHKNHEPYQDYIKKIAPHPIAVKVKLADMNHNINRLIGLPEEEGKICSLSKIYQHVALLVSVIDLWDNVYTLIGTHPDSNFPNISGWVLPGEEAY